MAYLTRRAQGSEHDHTGRWGPATKAVNQLPRWFVGGRGPRWSIARGQVLKESVIACNGVKRNIHKLLQVGVHLPSKQGQLQTAAPPAVLPPAPVFARSHWVPNRPAGLYSSQVPGRTPTEMVNLPSQKGTTNTLTLVDDLNHKDNLKENQNKNKATTSISSVTVSSSTSTCSPPT